MAVFSLLLLAPACLPGCAVVRFLTFASSLTRKNRIFLVFSSDWIIVVVAVDDDGKAVIFIEQ